MRYVVTCGCVLASSHIKLHRSRYKESTVGLTRAVDFTKAAKSKGVDPKKRLK